MIIDATIVTMNKIEDAKVIEIVKKTDIEKETEKGIGNEFTIATADGMAQTKIDEEIVPASRARGRERTRWDGDVAGTRIYY